MRIVTLPAVRSITRLSVARQKTRGFHQISLVAFLAWVGLGAHGLSSSAYGPEEAFLALGRHFYLALPLAILMGGFYYFRQLRTNY